MKEGRVVYALFEKSILDFYEQGILTTNLLDRIANQYYQVYMDSAGSQRTLTHDGKDLHQVCIGLIVPAFPLAIRGSDEDHEEYWERELKQWEVIVSDRWGWHSVRHSVPLQNQCHLTKNL